MGLGSTVVFTLGEAEIHQLEESLRKDGWSFGKAPYAHWRATREKNNATAYLSGKTTFQGADALPLSQHYLPQAQPTPAKHAAGKASTAGNAIVGMTPLELALRKDPEMFTLHAGIDESGKGDFFGPLVIACACTDAESAAKLLDAGVRDSKALSSDREALRLDQFIRETLPGHFALITIGPERLNQLHAQSGNLNRLLAWGHAKTLEELLTLVPDCPRAISDQFGKGDLVKRQLQERGRKILLDEHPRAEADIAVAAASILARAAYIKALDRLSQQAGLKLPKGAGHNVLACAREFLKLHPKAELPKYAKVFFKTTEQL